MSYENPALSPVRTVDPPRAWPLSRLSWGSIFAGAFVAAALHLVLALLTISLGIRLVNPYAGGLAHITRGVMAASGIAWAVSAVISLWIGGWIAGRTSGPGLGNGGGLHGAAVWGLVTVATFGLATAGLAASHSDRGLAAGPIAGDVAAAAGPNPSAEAAGQQPTAPLTPSRRQAMDRASRALAEFASWTFLVVAVGAFAAGWGGRCGALRAAALCDHP